MAVRFQADNDLRLHYVRAVRRSEPAIEDRILVSHDKRTLPRALAKLIREGVDSPGIFLVIPQNAEIRRVAESLILVWAASDPVEWRNRITKIPF